MFLICAAWQNEIKDLPAMPNVQIETLGIGYLEAALNLEKILQENREIEAVIFLGTAGAYSQILQIGELVEIKSVALLNRGEVLGQSYHPKKYQRFQSHAKHKFAKDLALVDCLSSLEITSDEKFSQQVTEFYDEASPLVENMELYGVAKVCCDHDIPWSAVLGISNYTNQNAHQDWQVNEPKLADKFTQLPVWKIIG